MNRHTQVVVIGGGIAGLAAANALKTRGIANVVVEARNRLGGRIHTESSWGIPISLGAQWMHGTEDNPLKPIADSLDLRCKESGFNHVVIYDRKGNLIPFEKVATFYEDFDKQIEAAKKFSLKQKADVSLDYALKNTVDFISDAPLLHDLYRVAKSRLTLYTGASLKNLSGRHWDEEIILAGGNPMMLDGFTPIINELAKEINLELNTVVREIRKEKNIFYIETNRGALTADQVILTVPLGVLKHQQIKFIPELPVSKMEAISKLDMGVLNSLVLKFPEVFWPHEQGLQFAKNFQFSIYTNLDWFYKHPILTARVAGDIAKQLEKLPDKEWVAIAMSELRHFFGKDIPEPEKYLITRWSQDPFAFGSYSYLPVGATPDDFDKLAEPVGGNLFFAGEATYRSHPGTVHGAYLSGVKAADQLSL